jgi:hypothetical protein
MNREKLVENRERRRGGRLGFARPPLRIAALPTLEALEILGIASRTASANAGDSQNAHLRLERWAVEAALRRRSFEELSSSDIHLIRGSTHDGDAVKWPRSSLDHP